MKRFMLLLTALCLILAVVAIYIVFCEANFKDVYPTKDFKEAGPFGDYVGGIIGTLVSAAGIFLLLVNFYEQRKSFDRERLETQFYERIKTYREHLYELSFTKKKRINSGILTKIFSNSAKLEATTYTGRKVFKIIYHDFIQLYEETEFFFKRFSANEIYLPKYKSWIEKNPVIQSRAIDLLELARIDIVYCMIFTGLSSEERTTLIDIFSKRYCQSFTDCVIAFSALKPVAHSSSYSRWEALNASKALENNIFTTRFIRSGKARALITREGHLYFVNKILRNEGLISPESSIEPFYKFYGGHQFRLGHYFRHLFNSINFIDKSPRLSYDTKLTYIISLRSQLSTFEQMVFFLNSLSSYGRLWELEDEAERKYIKPNRQLITKYNLIRNISTIRLADKIDVSHYYPEVLFESRYKSKNRNEREKLETKYRYPFLFKFFSAKKQKSKN
jgi:hypothetical protein